MEKTIDDIKFRRVIRWISIIPILMIIISASFSCYILIKYRDYPEFRQVNTTTIQTWKYFNEDKLRLFRNYRNEYENNYVLLLFGLTIFILTGIPNIADTIRYPEKRLPIFIVKMIKSHRKTN